MTCANRRGKPIKRSNKYCRGIAECIRACDSPHKNTIEILPKFMGINFKDITPIGSYGTDAEELSW